MKPCLILFGGLLGVEAFLLTPGEHFLSRTFPNRMNSVRFGSRAFVCKVDSKSQLLSNSRRNVLALFFVLANSLGKNSLALENEATLDLNSKNTANYPSEEEINTVRQGIQAFDRKDLSQAKDLFSKSISRWEVLQRPRDELAELYKMRGNVLVDLKEFLPAKQDYDHVLSLMAPDGQKADGTAAYMEYPDTFVQRGLCNEGLGDWAAAVADYSKAISLWGGGRGEGVNPFVLTFRGNALGRLQRFSEAAADYQAAETIFLARRDAERAADARANLALALYGSGEVAGAVLAMRDVVQRQPGYADMHVALAAHAWATGRLAAAESEWQFACDQTTVGCSRYRDAVWVSTVRRWPPPLARALSDFLARRAPAAPAVP